MAVAAFHMNIEDWVNHQGVNETHRSPSSCSFWVSHPDPFIGDTIEDNKEKLGLSDPRSIELDTPMRQAPMKRAPLKEHGEYDDETYRPMCRPIKRPSLIHDPLISYSHDDSDAMALHIQPDVEMEPYSYFYTEDFFVASPTSYHMHPGDPSYGDPPPNPAPGAMMYRFDDSMLMRANTYPSIAHLPNAVNINNEASSSRAQHHQHQSYGREGRQSSTINHDVSVSSSRMDHSERRVQPKRSIVKTTIDETGPSTEIDNMPLVMAPMPSAGFLTSSGENTAQYRLSPTQRELSEAKTCRAKSALNVWYQRLRELAAYKQEHGDCNVPQKYTPNPQLGIWVNKQRMERKFMDDGERSSMTVDRLHALDQVGFLWAKRKGDTSWNEKYRALVEYHDRHGHCDVATKYSVDKALGRWVSTQRSQYKQWVRGEPTHMTRDRYEKLAKLNFKFDMTKKNETK